jgi:hypothetical protein
MNKMIPAGDFISMFPGVTRIPYGKEFVYNILMENYETVVVNNLMCETLHPANTIAQMYKTKMGL